jgi:hypothetical protein
MGAFEFVGDPPPPDDVEPWRLLDLEEASARLGRSTRWVRDRVNRGELARVVLDGGDWRFLLVDLQAFAEARRTSADGASPLARRLQPTREPARGNGSAERDRLAKPRVPPR